MEDKIIEFDVRNEFHEFLLTDNNVRERSTDRFFVQVQLIFFFFFWEGDQFQQFFFQILYFRDQKNGQGCIKGRSQSFGDIVSFDRLRRREIEKLIDRVSG